MTGRRATFPYNEAWLRYAWSAWLSRYYDSGAVVDCACGIGVNGGVLRALGVPKVIGLDVDWGCLLESRARGLDVLRADLSAFVPLRSGIADIVLLIHCLEHFEAGGNLLSSVARALRPGGAVVVVTPDWTRAFRSFYDDPTHQRPYTRESLQAALLAAGLRPRVLLRHNVGYRLGRSLLWRLFPRLCFTGDALFALAERPR